MDSAVPPPRVVTLDQLLAADRDAHVVRRAPAPMPPLADENADPAHGVSPPSSADPSPSAVVDHAPPGDAVAPSRPRTVPRDPGEPTHRLLDLRDDAESRTSCGSTPP